MSLNICFLCGSLKGKVCVCMRMCVCVRVCVCVHILISPDPVQPLSHSPIPSSSAPQSSEQIAGWHSPSTEWTSTMTIREDGTVVNTGKPLNTRQ